MSVFKEFQGKDLDSAIQEACAYFGVARAHLEIEILRDAKSGIFGIVGTRKAAIRARRTDFSPVEDTLSVTEESREDVPAPKAEEREAAQPRKASRPTHRGRRSSARARRNEEEKVQAQTYPKNDVGEVLSGPAHINQDVTDFLTEAEASEPQQEQQKKPLQENVLQKNVLQEDAPREDALREGAREDAQRAGTEVSRARPHSRSRQRTPRGTELPLAKNVEESSAPEDRPPFEIEDIPEEFPEGLPLISQEQLASEEFRLLLKDILTHLITPILGEEVGLEFEVFQNKIRVHIDSGELSGLLIGRDGQTLVAIRYLTSRILTHKLGVAVRLQLDVGEYRKRQEEKLREVALHLAERARETGRSFSTRPLSSYHRRLVHLFLEDFDDIQTRSIGTGAMKRMLVMCKPPEVSPEQTGDAPETDEPLV